MFTEEEITEIQNTHMSHLIIRNSFGKVTDKDIQENVWFHVDGDPCPQPAQLS